MVKILDIDRTATFAISNHNLPYLATANVAGAIDVDFSDSSKLEIWNPFSAENKATPINSIDIDSKLYDLTWSADNKLLVGGLENGTVQFWNGDALINKKTSDITTHTATNHTSAVRSLAFNHTKPNVLLSGSANSEIFVWDTNKLSADPLTPTGEPYANDKSGGKKSIEEINSLSWNHLVPHVFASASNTGFTSIWDLKSKRKVVNLSYTATTANGNIRANLSSVAWHPTQSTTLITSSDLDSLPVVLQWDLRFSKTPEIIFGGPSEFNTNQQSQPGHSKGILSIDWLSQDSDFLLTSGKDSNTFLWDTKTGDKIASYPLHAKTSTINAVGSNSSSDWVFKSKFAGKNPEYFANATFDGQVIFQTLQDTSSNKPQEVDTQKGVTKVSAKQETSETDFWNQISTEGNLGNDEFKEDVKPEIYIKKAPKWLARPSSVSFAFGGKLVCIKTSQDEKKNNVSVIEVSNVKLVGAAEETENNKKLLTVLNEDEEAIKSIIKEKSAGEEEQSFDWKLLNELKSLGNDRKKLLQKHISPEPAKAVSGDDKKEEDKEEKEESSSNNVEATATEGEDFFSNLAETSQEKEAAETSTAESAATKIFKPTGEFDIFSSSDDEITTNLKKLILSGKFSEAVTVSLDNDKVIEALIIALSSKDETLKQKVLGHYFAENIEKKSDSLIRLLYSTSNFLPTVSASEGSSSAESSNDAISDLVGNGSVDNWQEIALGIFTYIKDDAKFNANITKLGNRVYESGSRDNAILLYFIGGSLNNISDIWLKELEAKEKDIVNTKSVDKHKSLLDIYYSLLDELIIKVLIFRKSLGVAGELPNIKSYEKLIKIFLDYIKNVGDNSGNFELVGKLLDILPSDLSDVELGKARIGKSTAKASATAAASTKAAGQTGRAKYVSPSLNRYGSGVTSAAASVPSYGLPINGSTPAAGGIGLSSVPAPVVSSRASVSGKKTTRPKYIAPQTSSAGPYGQPFAPSSVPAAPAISNAYAPQGVASSPYAPAIKTNGYTPSANNSVSSSPYTPHSNLVGANNGTGFNNFANNTIPAPPTTGASRFSSSQNPQRAKKPGHEGWNDLPDTFAEVTNKATKRKAAPVSVAPAFNGAPNAPSPGQPPFARNSSFSIATPPPPKASSRSNASALNSPRTSNAGLSTPTSPPSQTSSKYAPPPSVNTNKFSAPPIQSPPPVNPYAPQSQFSTFDAPANNLYGRSSLSGSSTPLAPGPPPIGKRNFNAPPPAPAQVSQVPQVNSSYAPLQQQQQAPPPVFNGPYGSGSQSFVPGPPPARAPTAVESIAAQSQNPSTVSVATPPPPPVSSKPKHPAGDRSHIPPSAQPIFQLLSTELNNVKPKIPAKYAKKTNDTEKRVNILFDHLNNEDLLSEETIGLLTQLANALAGKDYATAHSLQLEIATNHSSEAGSWLMGVKRLIDMVEATAEM